MENLDTLVDVLGARTVNLHLKDHGIFRPPHRNGFVVEGRGQLDVPRLLNAIRGVGHDPDDFEDPWAVEVQPGNYMAFFEPRDSGEYDNLIDWIETS